MKKHGFTLAEVLITMGIVGIIAAMTTPALVGNVQRQGYATALRSTVTDLENAFTVAIATEDVDDLYGTQMWANAPITVNSANRQDFIDALGQFLKTNGADGNNNGLTYYTSRGLHSHGLTANGKTNNIALDRIENNYLPINLKNGAVMFIRTFNFANGGTINAADIFIDVNGADAPNTVGRDIHPFYLASNGTMLPCGGQILDNEGEMNSWRNSCTNGNLGNAGNWWGVTCTGRLVENNYVFDY